MGKISPYAPYFDPPENYVAYDWPSSNTFSGNFWNRRRDKVVKALENVYLSYTDNIPKLIDLAERVRDIGEKERIKELNYLRINLPDFDFTNISEKDLIFKLNEIINGVDQFKNALDRIEIALSRKDFKRAPSQTANFASYLTTALHEYIRTLAENFTPSQAINEWKTNFDAIIEKIMDRAFEKTYNEIGQNGYAVDNVYGDAAQWKSVYDAYTKLQSFQKQYKNILKGLLAKDIENLRHVFDSDEGKQIMRRVHTNAMNAKKKGNKTYQLGGFAQQTNWRSTFKSNYLQGGMNEFITTLMREMVPKNVTITNYEQHNKNLETNMARTDTFQLAIYEADININIEKILEQFSEAMKSNLSLEDAAKNFREFYDNNLAHLSNNSFFTVYSNKLYSLSENFSGFHNGETQHFDRLANYADMAGISQDRIWDFIHMAYNTLDGAVYNDKRAEVEENVRNILTAAAARLLFDDWSTIGQVQTTGAQVLNFFSLDDVIVPSSILFKGLGLAMKEAAEELKDKSEMNKWFSVEIHLPETVVYHPGDWRYKKEFGTTSETIKKKIYEKWEEQRKKAEKESYFNTKFFLNFKSLAKEWIKKA